MRKEKTTITEVSADFSNLSVREGDCFGTYEGTNNACLKCHDSHACATLKQMNVMSKAAKTTPEVSIGRDGLFIAEFDQLVQPGKSVADLVYQVKRSNNHLSEALITMKLKAYCLANKFTIKAGIVCE